MIRNLFILAIVLLLMVPVIGFAQNDDDSEYAFIDIASAEKRVGELTQENVMLEQERKDLEAENKNLKNQVKNEEDKLKKVDTMILKIKGKGPALYEYKSNVVDKSGRDKATDAFSNYKEILDKLIMTKENLEYSVRAKKDKIAENNDRSATDLYKIKINNREIKELENAIKNTKGQVQDIDTQIDSLNDYIKDAELLLQ